MTEDLVLSFLPYLNTGAILLIVDLAFRRIGWEITMKNYKEMPIRSFVGGLCLIAISSFFGQILASALSGYTPTAVFLVLIFSYFAVVYGRSEIGKSRKQRR